MSNLSQKYKKCSISNCNNIIGEHGAKGYCKLHYDRFHKHGDANYEYQFKLNGLSKHELYKTYKGMLSRCYDYNSKSFKNYGGRGITVCNRWKGKNGLSNFIKDMGERPDGYTIDRINRDCNYSPDNCKWSHIYEQNYNRGKPSDNTSGHIGITFEKERNKWRAYISYMGVRNRLGSFKTKEEAINARLEAEKEIDYNRALPRGKANVEHFKSKKA